MPVVLTKDEWSRITRWTDGGHEDPETVRRREYVKYLNDTSRQMTKNWPNSLENVNKRNEELRRARADAAEQANAKFYKRYMTRKREQQEQLMYSARDTVFRHRDAPKLLLSAVIETVTLKEREEQLKFNAELQRQAAEQKRRDDDDIIRKAREWNELMALRRKRRFETNKQHQKEILEQAHEISERNREEYETELNLQKVDNIKADQEMEAIKKFEEDFLAEEKARIWSDMKRSREEADSRRREQAARDLMDDRLLEVLLRSRARIEQKRRQTEKDIKDEKLRVLEKISQKLESGDAAREAKEQAILQKAVQEKEAAAEARRQAQEAKIQRFKEQRIQDRKKFLQDEERRLHEFNTVRQWDIMNRFKNMELYEEFKERLRQEKERKVQEYREDILKLWRERSEREAAERAALRSFYGAEAEARLRAEDCKLLVHGGKLLQEAAANGRPDFPLKRAIDRYCKMYRLYPMPELPASMQEHFGRYAPADRSAPDPGYRDPPPPLATVQEDDDAVDVRRDGLQVAGPSNPISKKPDPEPEADYKRSGRANGLQTKREASLPPIGVKPCATPQCRCENKK